MNFTFITIFKKITYKYYLKTAKSRLEWRLTEKLSRNPEFIKAFDRTLSHPLIRESSFIDHVEN